MMFGYCHHHRKRNTHARIEGRVSYEEGTAHAGKKVAWAPTPLVHHSWVVSIVMRLRAPFKLVGGYDVDVQQDSYTDDMVNVCEIQACNI